MTRVRLAPPYNQGFDASLDPTPEIQYLENRLDEVFTYLTDIHRRVGESPFLIQGYDVANLPSAADWGSTASSDAFSSLIFIYNETGGAVLAFSDGTNWRRVTDRAIAA